MLYQVLGLVNVALLVGLLAPYCLRKLNAWFFHFKGLGYRKTMKALRIAHKPMGIALAVVALLHGFLALGGLRPHTGSITWVFVLATACLGGAFYKLRKAGLLKTHRVLALLVVLLAAVHILWPNALYMLTH